MEGCFGRKTLLQQVYDEIDDCESMEYLWSQKKDSVKHTAVVIKFDLTPKFSIDFGAVKKTLKDRGKVAGVSSCVFVSGISGSVSPSSTQLAKKLIRKVTLEGKVTISDYLPSESKSMGKLVKIPIQSPEEKAKAIRVFNGIKEMKFEDYQLMTNNCRSHVIAIAEYLKNELPEFKEKNWKLFQQQMQNIQNEDNEKLEKLVSSPSSFSLSISKKQNDDNEKLEKSASSPVSLSQNISKKQNDKANKNDELEEVAVQQENFS